MSGKINLVKILFGIGLCSAVCVSAADDSGKFLKNASQAGMAEVSQAKLALKKTSIKRVRTFARHMIADHGKANAKVAKLAGRKNVRLPKRVSSDQQAAYAKLSGLTGPDFDRAYMDQSVADHKMAVNAFEAQSGDGSDASVKAFATATLPTLRMHLDMARDLDTTLTKDPERGQMDNQSIEKKTE